jgi:hypothetical protein
MSIVNACFELSRRLKPRIFVLENVRGAQAYIGRAPLHRGPYYFWGDVALLPALPPGHIKHVKYGKYKANGYKVTRIVHSYQDFYGGANPLERARIPFELSYGLAMACQRGQATKETA